MVCPFTLFTVSLGCLSTFCNAVTPQPVSLNFGTQFFGSDGLWSAVQIRVGSPEQYVWVYPSTINPDTWVIGPDGCDGTLRCQASRGSLFYSNQSTTYVELGRYDLVQNRLGLRTNYGNYGLDTIAISDTVSAPAQVIATLFDPENFLGELGLGVQEPRFDDRINRLPLISTLVQNESIIPSHSYGYTAGAHYALKSVPGSLVLGGVDVTRFTNNNASFSLGPNYAPIIAIQNITVSSSQNSGTATLPGNWNSNPVTLMQESDAALFTIDTSTPFLWMPPAVCDVFALALNLTYNENLQLYVFTNVSSPQTLSDWNLTFSFSIADQASSALQYKIPISYNAFNLQLSYGFPGFNGTFTSPGINYFPLRRANSSSQYTIGRAFLQEAYLVVDYERAVFGLSPAELPDTNTILTQIVAIDRPADSTWAGPADQKSSSLSTGVKAGIGIAAAVVVVATCGIAFVFIRRRKIRKNGAKSRDKKRWRLSRSSKIPVKIEAQVSELLGDRRHPKELLADSSNTRFELPATNDPVEMPAEEVSEAYLASSRAPDITPVAHDNPGPPIKTNPNHRRSIRKDYNIRATINERPQSPAPPYSPSEMGRNTNSSGASVSPYDSGGSGGFGSHASSGQAISPIAQYGPQLHADETRSPVSPATGASQTVSSNGNGLDTQETSQNAVLAPPQQTAVLRSGSRNSRFREELVDDQNRISEGEESPPLRRRFSWED